ncbi:hypothetical protein HOU02_gp229 [Caulobacter phage CcrBL9]|uniref:Uncharacterized protein n=1 Tax=Caulobacter phage CcrBL9 TaxID=2283270 RepID=A0A385ECT7_9CAUD|nr:hypothetical protein HOU02_gp229 [Caulobacter phage CcrBL9]AXQ69496.1 hypothetical protein CcrBL9_gp472 [Caulobacter phage CcrBL9]
MTDQFTVEEIDRFRQWYNHMEDSNLEFVEPEDAKLAIKVHDLVGRRVSSRTRDIATPQKHFLLSFDEEDMSAQDSVSSTLTLVNVLMRRGVAFDITSETTIMLVCAPEVLEKVMPDLPGWRHAPLYETEESPRP